MLLCLVHENCFVFITIFLLYHSAPANIVLAHLLSECDTNEQNKRARVTFNSTIIFNIKYFYRVENLKL